MFSVKEKYISGERKDGNEKLLSDSISRFIDEMKL